ncbi:MAG TPA: biotin attachment protein [Cyanobacteria bacterium UBA11991]|nr:biotin/lipoyl-containing protein [Cyanobacteriota bacterium]MDY6359333.1 biotin/lipoyl-containing protein [Cyanobacteriota bacterium]MDY6363933.1 biotin/lipoyl-containing protein [Cyanobacteriota bacterium]MDY6383298.1 biotin/lipoyl-containing protein [Cyanobacteriota bacterium]HCB10851.1 biotin attachment protein [Cyanobacteria bacterium UBA11991]
MSKKPIKVMDTSFRDGFQSVYGARVFVDDFIPALQSAVKAGIRHFETAGGARFQSPIFYCNENAFETMDKIRAAVDEVAPGVNLQSLSRGVNVVGLDSQPRDVIDLHAKMFKKHGVTTVRNFDALNDVNNLIYSSQCIKKHGLKHEVTITMMELPIGCTGAHDVAFYERVLRSILDSGIEFDSLAFKDASGTSAPRKVYETVKRTREILGPDVDIRFHSHETAGTGLAAYLAALDGGANCIDLSMKPVSGGTAQPDIVSMWHALKYTDYDLGINVEKILETEEIFKECMKDYFLPPEAMSTNPMIIQSPLPGGALTANTQMLRDNNLMDKYPEIVTAMKEVVEKGGFGTSVTPVSQFYFQQAFNNVMFGKWKKIAEGYGKMVLGYFGHTPCQPDAEVIKIAEEQLGLQPTTEHVVDLNDKDPNKGLAVAKKRLEDANLPVTDENLFISAACKEKGILFLQGKGTIGVRKKSVADSEPKAEGNNTNGYTVTVNGKKYAVALEGDKATVNGKLYDFSIKDGIEAKAVSGSGTPVKAALPGNVLKVLVSEGDSIAEGDVIAVIEAMKMETEIKSPVGGTVKSVDIEVGNKVQTGQVLVTIG